MLQRGSFFAIVLAAAAILGYQLFVPPIIGLADQGDFRRTIGKFGYGPEHGGSLNIAWVERKYVPSQNFRSRPWEQVSSEYLFTGAAVLLDRLVSRDGNFDLVVMGFVHAIIFLAIFARFLFVTRDLRARWFLWLGALVVFTDIGYTAYWNSFYEEPASGLFAFLLLTESIDICKRGSVSGASLARWSLWALLLVFAKPQNAPLGLLLAPFCALILGGRTTSPRAQWGAWIAGASIAGAACIVFLTAPQELKDANTYGLVFMAILPESKNPAADLEALGLDPQFKDYSGTGPWSEKTLYVELHASGEIGRKVTLLTADWFYMTRPARLWRHVKAMLPVSTSLRPEWSGNFEPSAGHPAGARSRAFSFWSTVHERVLVRTIKFLLLALPIPALLALLSRFRAAKPNLWLDFAGLLTLCCLAAFLTAIFGDAWDNVRHLYLFNLLLDACLLAAGSCLWQLRRTWTRAPSEPRRKH
ncbi:MAG: hypothetical protein ACRD5L_08975 [Bryobacteraceae bacterium]